MEHLTGTAWILKRYVLDRDVPRLTVRMGTTGGRERLIVVQEILQALTHGPAGLEVAVKIPNPADGSCQDFHVGHKGHQRPWGNLLAENQVAAVPDHQHNS